MKKLLFILICLTFTCIGLQTASCREGPKPRYYEVQYKDTTKDTVCIESFAEPLLFENGCIIVKSHDSQTYLVAACNVRNFTEVGEQIFYSSTNPTKIKLE